MDVPSAQAASSISAMDGFPPRPETRITTGNWFEPPWLRWSMLNRDRMMPSATAWRGDGPVWQLPYAQQRLDDLRVAWSDAETIGLVPALERMDSDAFLVMHRGRVVFETYLHGMRAQQRHMLASVSKSFVGLLAGILAGQGVVDLGRSAESYVPEMAGTVMGPATLQQLLDMTSGIGRLPMAHRNAAVGGRDGGLYEVLGLLPLVPGEPDNLYDLILRKPRAAAPGTAYLYDNSVTEAAAWVLKRATGMDLAEMLSTLLWSRIGAERDAQYSTDRQGTECASGGLAVTLRDLARVGEMLRCEGSANGVQVIPPAFLDDTRRGGDRALFAAGEDATNMPNGSYRNCFWIEHDAHGSFACIGRYGQRVHVVPPAELVVVQLSSNAAPPPDPFALPRRRLYRTLIEHFLPA